MYRRLLVAYDDSQPARAALRFALRLLGADGPRVSVVHVVVPGLRDPSLPATPEAAEQWLAEKVGAAGVDPGAEPKLELEIVEATAPAAALLDSQQSLGADLVLAGRTGAGGLMRFLIGTTPSRLVEHLPCSVAIFPPGEPDAEAELRNVIAGVDGSPPAREALSQAASIAAALSLPLWVAQVTDYRLPLARMGPYAGVRDALREHGELVLDEACSGLAAPLESVRRLHLEGDPRDQLVNAAADRPGALLVVGHRGTGGFAGLRLGGVATHLAREAPCPVIVARPSPNVPERRA